MSFQNKYLKYKNKYLDLKNSVQTGGMQQKYLDRVANTMRTDTNPDGSQVVRVVQHNPVVQSTDQDSSRSATNSTYLGNGDMVFVGDRVRERDSLMTGVVIEIHDKYDPYTHVVMKGDDGEIYDHNTHHYVKLSKESDRQRKKIESELQERAKKKAEQKISDKRAGRLLEIGDRVRERDSSMTGIVIKVYNTFDLTDIVMKGDDGKNYDHHISHYQFLE
jgi:hypothetical protein